MEITEEKLRENFSLWGFKGDSAIHNITEYIEEIKNIVRL